jgi:hypothetical protein
MNEHVSSQLVNKISELLNSARTKLIRNYEENERKFYEIESNINNWSFIISRHIKNNNWTKEYARF